MTMNTIAYSQGGSQSLPKGGRESAPRQEVSADARAAMYAVTPERALLSNILLCPSGYREYMGELSPLDFTDERVDIFQAMCACDSPDYATVETYLQSTGKGYCSAEMMNIFNEPAAITDTPNAWIDAMKTASARRLLYHIQRQTDLLAYNGRVDPYEAIADMIPRLQAILDTQDGSVEQERFQPYSLCELLERPAAPWVWRGYYRAGTRWLIYGESHAGKTLAAVDIGLSYATGLDWQDHATLCCGPVLYIAAEDAPGVAGMAKTWLAHHQKRLSDVAGKFYVVDDAVDLLDQADVARLIGRVQALGVAFDLVIIDTFSECFSGNFIDNQQLVQAFRGIGAIEKALSCGSLTIAHSNKAGISWLGGQYIKANLDAMSELSQEKDTGLVTLRSEKLRHAPKPATLACKISVFSDDVTFEQVAVLTPAKGVPVETGRKLNHTQEAALLALKDGMRATVWEIASGLPKTTFYKARDFLAAAGYVTETGPYALTEKGAGYLESIQSTPLPNRSNGTNGTGPLHSHPPIGVGVDGPMGPPVPVIPEPPPARYDEQTQMLPSDSRTYGALNSAQPESSGSMALAPGWETEADELSDTGNHRVVRLEKAPVSLQDAATRKVAETARHWQEHTDWPGVSAEPPAQQIGAWARERGWPDRMTPYGRFRNQREWQMEVMMKPEAQQVALLEYLHNLRT